MRVRLETRRGLVVWELIWCFGPCLITYVLWISVAVQWHIRGLFPLIQPNRNVKCPLCICSRVRRHLSLMMTESQRVSFVWILSTSCRSEAFLPVEVGTGWSQSQHVREVFLMAGSFSRHVRHCPPPHFRGGGALDLLSSLLSLRWLPQWSPNNAGTLPSMRDLCFGLVNHPLSLPMVPRPPPIPPSGNNGVHGSVVSANTPSIMTLAAIYC